MRTIHLLSALVAAAWVAGCGGGGGDAPAPAPAAASDAVPDAASASAEGMTAWLTALSREDAEAKEPLDVSRFNPASTEEAEPQALN